MAVVCDQFDVFKIPHSRMMQLVNSCNKNLSTTDFANNDALLYLLSNLQTIFREFKTHEEIENEHIMTKLKTKLKSMAIYNSAVCNCHKDDEFTPLFDLVNSGYLFINKTNSVSERLNFGIRLRKALSSFTKRFVPHMKEEEEIFQPLLLEYFTRDELSEMKTVVIKLHMQQRKFSAFVASSHNVSAPIKPTQCDNVEVVEPQMHGHVDIVSINQLPNELLLKIFSHLSIQDKLSTAQVSRKWNSLVYDQVNWKRLNLADWKSKDNTNNESDNVPEPKHQQFVLDENEDIYDSKYENVSKDLKTLKFWIKYLLPKVGKFVFKLDLSYCNSLNNNITRRILQLCPNVSDLNLSYTRIGDNSFRGVLLDKLRNLNCEGCEKLSDNAFKYLLISSTINMIKAKSQTCTKRGTCSVATSQPSGSKCFDKQNIEDVGLGDFSRLNAFHCELISNESESKNFSSDLTSAFNNSLESINLSGCWSITDYGLSFIASKYDLSQLQYLNLSGCINLTSLGMNLFVEPSHLLKGENLYYCDNIVDGPLKQSANGCENLECGSKFCCRSN